MVMRWINDPDAVARERRAVYGPTSAAGWVTWGGCLALLGAGLFWIGLNLGTDAHSIEEYLGALRRSDQAPDNVAGIGIGQWGIASVVAGMVFLLIGAAKITVKIDELLKVSERRLRQSDHDV